MKYESRVRPFWQTKPDSRDVWQQRRDSAAERQRLRDLGVELGLLESDFRLAKGSERQYALDNIASKMHGVGEEMSRIRDRLGPSKARS